MGERGFFFGNQTKAPAFRLGHPRRDECAKQSPNVTAGGHDSNEIWALVNQHGQEEEGAPEGYQPGLPAGQVTGQLELQTALIFHCTPKIQLHPWL